MTKPYCIGSDEWNGLSKLIEELGELQQVCGKIIGSEGNPDHWSGDLQAKFIEEIGDVKAAIKFFVRNNFNSDEQISIQDQSINKYWKFVDWDAEVKAQNDNGEIK